MLTDSYGKRYHFCKVFQINCVSLVKTGNVASVDIKLEGEMYNCYIYD